MRDELRKLLHDGAARLSNSYGVVNQSFAGREEVYVCRNIRLPWPEFWKNFLYYG
jgi:hypothetical protein